MEFNDYVHGNAANPEIMQLNDDTILCFYNERLRRGKDQPFAIASTTYGLWNSLFVKGSNTVTAISTTTVNNVQGLWAIDGHVRNPEK